MSRYCPLGLMLTRIFLNELHQVYGTAYAIGRPVHHCAEHRVGLLHFREVAVVRLAGVDFRSGFRPSVGDRKADALHYLVPVAWDDQLHLPGHAVWSGI